MERSNTPGKLEEKLEHFECKNGSQVKLTALSLGPSHPEPHGIIIKRTMHGWQITGPKGDRVIMYDPSHSDCV